MRTVMLSVDCGTEYLWHDSVVRCVRPEWHDGEHRSRSGFAWNTRTPRGRRSGGGGRLASLRMP